MIGVGMIFDETYAPLFEQLQTDGLFRRDFGFVEIPLVAVASRTGTRAARYAKERAGRIGPFANCSGPNAVGELLARDVDVVCIATPDDRHFDAARQALSAGKHVLIEKPSVLSLQQLDELHALAARNAVLAKVVYHKLADPDHKKLRTLVADGVLQHVNNGYCTLLEPKSISGKQFAEWIVGRNPGTYVAVHYIKLIDFTFSTASSPLPCHLSRVTATGQRGLVDLPDSSTWDSVQMQLVYAYADGREAAFDIHTSWVTPENFPGYVEQEVQFRFDNGIWLAHQRKRGVEVTVEDGSPARFKYTPNNHYSSESLEPSGRRLRRGYGIEILRDFFEEVAFVEFGGSPADRAGRLARMRGLAYNDLSADRPVVAAVQALEAILQHHAAGRPNAVVTVNDSAGGLVLRLPGNAQPEVLYAPAV
jgi:predicted dehydrogenase